MQAIANEIQQQLNEMGERPTNVEGLENAEWVLMDYGDLVVHVFSEGARAYYDLDRLWRTSRDVTIEGVTSAAPVGPRELYSKSLIWSGTVGLAFLCWRS